MSVLCRHLLSQAGEAGLGKKREEVCPCWKWYVAIFDIAFALALPGQRGRCRGTAGLFDLSVYVGGGRRVAIKNS